MFSGDLKAIRVSLETAAGASTTANDNEIGEWKRIAAAAEVLAGASTTANETVLGLMRRTALALEAIAGGSGAEENDGYYGLLKRIVDALEIQAGAVTTGSLESRAVIAAANATFGFDPLSVSPAYWYDPSDLSSMFQTTDTSTPAAVDSPVGRINDKSGNNRHLLQATAGFRPTLRQSGDTYYLEFNGIDDVINATFTLNQPFDRISALRMVTYTAADRIFDGINPATGTLWTPGPTPNLALFDGSTAAVNSNAVVGTSFVATERHDNTNSRLAVNNTAYTTGTSGTGNPGGISVGPATAPGNFFFYGMIGKAAFTDPEIASLRTYLGAKAGLVL